MTLDMNGKSVRDKNKTAKKLHQQFGHPTHDKLLQLVKTAGVEDGEFQDQLKKVAENCTTCIKFKRKNPRPIMGMSLSKDFNNTVAMDLKQYGQKYILHIIDLATRYSNAVLINSRHKDVVVENLIRMWVNTFGVPDKILTDNGEEFNNEEPIMERSLLMKNSLE